MWTVSMSLVAFIHVLPNAFRIFSTFPRAPSPSPKRADYVTVTSSDGDCPFPTRVGANNALRESDHIPPVEVEEIE
ncbi:hypothetical protein OBBRIDRAFT_329295 [Obba rivulosa]|uniref:Secreted protein n=1 Tax=Obba rivulosa TaxID=1052685 RepID=A0A8E2AKW7_9APHY|nr:hypothetical protein OBBRIDRAFT_329295 [Obba rivulosa]